MMDKKPKIICIVGKARSGKDTLADLLCRRFTKLDHSCLIAHNADLLKYICKTFLGWDGQKDEFGRTLLQQTGTQRFRKSNPDFWVDFLIHVVKEFSAAWDVVIIPDVRFPNEYHRWEEEGFDVTLIEVQRSKIKECEQLTTAQQQHESETSMMNVPVDIVINNDGSLEELQDIVAALDIL